MNLPQRLKPLVVELIVDAADTPEYGLFRGLYHLRALDGRGRVLYEARQEILALDAIASDNTRLRLIGDALERLTGKLKTEEAPYRLRIVQTSKMVEGWLRQGWKQNTSTAVRALCQPIDQLLKRFPDREWVRLPRAQFDSLLSKVSTTKGGSR